MSPHLTSQQFLRVAAVVFVILAAAIAVIQGRRGEDATVVAPMGAGEADAVVRELARCRTIAPDDTAGLDACRRIWAENRQRFFVPTDSSQSPAPPAANAPAERTKSQERVPPQKVDQGRTR
jgi:conjugative transfer region protein TrbK